MNSPIKTEFFDGRARLIEFSRQRDARGSLLPFNFEELPFVPRHAFTVQGVPAGVVRGQHAHRYIQQLVICLAGEVRVELREAGRSETLALDRPDVGLFIAENLWAAQSYRNPETIVLVLASAPYNPASYLEEPAS